jgi:hypothetical protein
MQIIQFASLKAHSHRHPKAGSLSLLKLSLKNSTLLRQSQLPNDLQKLRMSLQKYHEFILNQSIKPESIWNMDETGFRIGIPGGERVIVPRAVKELYTPSPENRTSIMIIEAVSVVGEVIPPVLNIPGKIHMDSWYHSTFKAQSLCYSLTPDLSTANLLYGG